VAALGGEPVSLPLAHLGHWWGQIVFAAPVLILVGVLLYDKVRSRRRERKSEPH